MKNKFELLAPAGNKESFYASCNAGADAIYMGLEEFNARAMAENFSINEYKECIKHAHRLGIKVYLTLNTLLKSDEIKDALRLIFELYSAGLDAVILQDIGFASKVKEIFPELAMHASTQMSVYTLEQVKFLEALGFSRVVLARELTLEEIEYICKNTKVEIEVFVHGALCVSMSGQCLLSYSIGGRSANRGACAQPCRMKYSLINKTKDEMVAKDSYLLSKKDIFGIDKISDLKKAGVYSFKIEGRNRSPLYTYIAVSKYRKAIDESPVSSLDKKELSQVFIREGRSEGYLNGVEYKKSITNISPKNTGLYLGKVLEQRGKFVKVKLNEEVNLHDGIEIYNEKTLEIEHSSIITCIKDDKGKTINKIKALDPGSYVWLGDVNKKVTIKSPIYKTSSAILGSKHSKIKEVKPKKSVEVFITKAEKLRAVTCVEGKEIVTVIDEIPEEAISSALTYEKIENAFRKSGEDDIEFDDIRVNLENCLFVPISALNKLRNKHSENVTKYIDESSIRIIDNAEEIEARINNIEKSIIKSSIQRDSHKSLYIYKFDKDKSYNLTGINRVYISDADFMRCTNDIFDYFEDKNVELFLSTGNFVGEKVSKYIKENAEALIDRGVKGIMLGSFELYELALMLKRKYQIKLVADYSFNISNIYSASLFKTLEFDEVAPLVELSNEEIAEISDIIDTEVVEDYIVAMTSRYCMIGAFQENRDTYKDKCQKPCIKNRYVMKDIKGCEYDIVCDPYSCIMKVLKPIDRKHENTKSNIRKCYI